MFHEAASLQHRVRADRSVPEREREVDAQAAAYDRWFREEVEAGVREANDPDTQWVTQEEVERQSARQEAAILSLLAVHPEVE